MELCSKESSNASITGEFHTNFQTETSAEKYMKDTENEMEGIENDIEDVKNDIENVKNEIEGIKSMIEDVTFMSDQHIDETIISDGRASVNRVLDECISDHADNAQAYDLEKDKIPDFEHADNVQTYDLEKDKLPDFDHTDNVQTYDLVKDKILDSDHVDNVQTYDFEKDKIPDSNDNDLFSDDLEITYDSANENKPFEIEYDFKHIPYQITGSWKEFSSVTRNNFTRGCKWAPDGSCILTCSDDNLLRIFNLPHQLWDPSQWQDITEMEAVVKISEGEIIYDYTWYPLMNSSDPSTCCLASASKNSTVHLWDGFTGELRCSYRTYNHMDEIVTPHSLSFDADGQKLFCGFEKVVRVFNVDTPGRDFEERYIFAKKVGQSGIVSCFAFTPADRKISAAGSYHKTIGIYSEPSGSMECILEGQKGGITQLQFSPDGMCLYSGGRKDPEILCWDLRNLGTVLFSLRRSCTTNQRMYFDISRCGRYVISGNQNGVISIWDVTEEPKIINEDEFAVLEPVQYFMAHNDCVNGISLHPTFPLLCSSSGQRKFPALLSEDDDGMFASKIDKYDNSLRLWWLGKSD